MDIVKIESESNVVGYVDEPFSDMVVKNEPMLFNNDIFGAYANGGTITHSFLNRLPDAWKHSPLTIDSRVHMLMPGWYPCIPGWHHDDVPRDREDGQPDYVSPGDRAEHIMMLVNAHLAPTEFAEGDHNFEVPPVGQVIYEMWHPLVQKMVERKMLNLVVAENQALIHFNDRTWHRGVAATGNGWRFFIRASRYFDKDGNVIPRRNTRTNEVRKQVQVYMSAENAGW